MLKIYGYRYILGRVLYDVGSLQRGHPKKTWLDCIKDDMESLGLF